MDSVDTWEHGTHGDTGIARSLGKTLNKRSHRGTELVTTSLCLRDPCGLFV
jgi:hypothetical protein